MSEPVDTVAAALADADRAEAAAKEVNDARAAVGVGPAGGAVALSRTLAAHVRALAAELVRLRERDALRAQEVADTDAAMLETQGRSDRLRERVRELEALVGSLSRRLCACSEALSRAAERQGLPVPDPVPASVRSPYQLRLARLAVRARWAECARRMTQ